MKGIEIDYYPNGRNVVLILTGLGGNVKGYENKYETITNNITSHYDFSVFVASTPYGSYENPKENLDYILEFVDNKMKTINNDYKIYVMGHSAGGTIMLWNIYNYPRIKRLIAINPVLNVNFHRLQNGIESFKGDFVKIIIGEKDNSYNLTGLLNNINSKQFELITLPNIDHEFRGNLKTFIELPTKYLLNKK